MIDEFKKNGINILKVYYCPHSPDENCTCRKPLPGMIFQAKNEFNIDINSSWLIGDKITDIEAAIASKINKYILISNSSNKNENYYSFIADNLFDTTNIIKE